MLSTGTANFAGAIAGCRSSCDDQRDPGRGGSLRQACVEGCERQSKPQRKFQVARVVNRQVSSSCKCGCGTKRQRSDSIVDVDRQFGQNRQSLSTFRQSDPSSAL